MSELEETLKSKLTVSTKYVVMCQMNQCARGGPGVIIALEDSEGIANQKAEAHRNLHRDHEKRYLAVMGRIKAMKEEAEVDSTQADLAMKFLDENKEDNGFVENIAKVMGA